MIPYNKVIMKKYSKDELVKYISILHSKIIENVNAGNQKDAMHMTVEVFKVIKNFNKLTKPERKEIKNVIPTGPREMSNMPERGDPANVSPFNPQNAS